MRWSAIDDERDIHRLAENARARAKEYLQAGDRAKAEPLFHAANLLIGGYFPGRHTYGDGSSRAGTMLREVRAGAVRKGKKLYINDEPHLNLIAKGDAEVFDAVKAISEGG
jgi:hypothetical protein